MGPDARGSRVVLEGIPHGIRSASSDAGILASWLLYAPSTIHTLTPLTTLPVLVLAFLPLPPQDTPPAKAGETDVSLPEAPTDEIGRIGLEFLVLAFELSPWLVEERGWTGRPFDLGSFGAQKRIDRIDTLDRLARELRKLRDSGGTPQEEADRKALAALVTAEHARYATRNPERWNADYHVMRVDRALRTKILSPRRPGQIRVEMLRILGLLPGYWKEARSALVSPIEEWTPLAIERLRRFEFDLEGWREDFVSGFKNDTQDDKANEAFDEALAATSAFRTWLEERPAGLGGTTMTLDAERWGTLVQAASGTVWSIEEIKWNVLRDLAHAEREYGPRWRSRSQDSEVLDSELFEQLDRVLGTASLQAMELAERAGALTSEAPDETVRFSTADLLPARYGVPVILLPGTGYTQQVLLDSAELSGADRAAQRVLGVRYGFPGVALLAYESQRARSVLPRFLWNRALFEGWGLYALDWIQRIDWVSNPFAADGAFRAEATRQRVLEGARLLASLALHGEGLSQAEAAEDFSRRTGVDLERATREVRTALLDPLRGVGYLGYVGLLERERSFERSADLAQAIGRTLAQTLASPHLRPADQP